MWRRRSGRRGVGCRFRSRPARRQLYRVALALGVSPSELEQRISQQELTEWAAFERVNGSILLHERIDWAGAVLSYVTAASHGSSISLRRLFSSYFDWDRTPPREEDTSAALGMILEAAASQPLPHSST